MYEGDKPPNEDRNIAIGAILIILFYLSVVIMTPETECPYGEKGAGILHPKNPQ